MDVTKPRAHGAVALAVAALLAWAASPGDARAATDGPFTHMAGAWSGGGTLTLATGAKEKIRCRAQYRVGGGGANLDLTIRCAGDAYQFELQSSVAHRGGALSGNWTEVTRNVGGALSGTANGNRIMVNVIGPLSAQMALNTTASRQSISIRSSGSELTDVSVTLSKGK